jgi:predicted phage replisome organizer
MSDCAVKWIKISTSMFDDEKIRYLEQMPEADSILAIWVKLLVLAGQKNAGGEIYLNDEMPYTDEMLAAIFHRKVNTVRLALEAFQKLRMIEIKADRTISICNWGKHQHLDGLERIKFLAGERQKRYRLKQRDQALLARGIRPPGNAVDYVTQRDVSRDNALPSRFQNENKNKSKSIEEPPTVPHGGTGVNDFNATKELLNKLFRRQLAWSEDEDRLLKALLPISRDDRALISWAYTLPRDSEGWALIDGEHTSKPKQSLLGLLREFSSEIHKWNVFQHMSPGGINDGRSGLT